MIYLVALFALVGLVAFCAASWLVAYILVGALDLMGFFPDDNRND